MGKHRPPDVSDDERSYEIGYRKPPADTRFQKGEGGNRKGRKRNKRKPLAVEMEEILSQRVPVRQGGKTVAMSMQRAILQTLATKAARGHDRSTELLIKLAGQAAKEGDAAMGDDLGADELTLLTRYIADVAAGNKAVDGSFPDEPMEYKEPPA